MQKKQNSTFIKQMLIDSLLYIIKGRLRVKNGHFPQINHLIPTDFFGVCVASNEDPATDDFIVGQLETVGIKNVRLDFSYDDLCSYNNRFLQKLIAADYNVTLHLLVPLDAAKNMADQSEQARWRVFLVTVLDQYGSSIKQVEVGNTINRKRWAGYTFDGFLIAWQIAHAEIKSRGIKLLGPNVQDFEPIYNIGILKALQNNNQLPDTHTNNLFVERVFEPERFDHRVLKYKWTRILKYNLVKKARTLQKIGLDFGVPYTTSSAAFWAVYRIKRILIAGEQKQADYLTRYFTLSAASGALRQANWGALICHREGLINDGLTRAEYPVLERIAQYKSADGMLNEYERYPSFYAMQSVVNYLSGAYYQATIASTKGLEIHHFNNTQFQFHIAWTINSKVAFLADIYSENTLKNAKIIHRDGDVLEKNTCLVCETPIYLCWDINFNIEARPYPKLAKNLAIHAHIDSLQYFRYNRDGWLGLVLAKDAAEADLLMQVLNPENLHSPKKDFSLRHARNVIWAVEDPRNTASQLTIKQPIKMYPHKALLDRLKPSKAKRSWNGAMELLRRGVGTAQPVAYFEKVGDNSLKQNFYICERVEADCSIGEIFSAFARGESTYHNLTPEIVYSQFAQFCNKVHSRLIYFRDFSGGNILVNIDKDKQLHFSLIDTARLRVLDTTPFPLKYRMADMVRACHKLHKDGREQLMQIYLGITGRKFNLRAKMTFYMYDLKVKLKRTIGRKGIKRLMKRFKGIQ